MNKRSPTEAGAFVAPVTNRQPGGTAARMRTFRTYSMPDAMKATGARALADQQATLLSLDASPAPQEPSK